MHKNESAGAGFGFLGGGEALGGVGIEEAAHALHKFPVPADVLGEELRETLAEGQFELEQLAFGNSAPGH